MIRKFVGGQQPERISREADEELFSHHLHDHALVTLTIELGVEDALPGPEIELAGGDGDDHFRGE